MDLSSINLTAEQISEYLNIGLAAFAAIALIVFLIGCIKGFWKQSFSFLYYLVCFGLLIIFVKDIALVTVLFIGGLGISLSQIKQIGRPAVLLSIVPATLEGFTVAFLYMKFLGFTFIQGSILGFIIAAVSPAVLIPSMVSLIERKIGQDKAIPQMLLVGASADDTIAITLFTTF